MGLHIVIGYGSASREAEPLPVYLGYSASDAAKAKAADTTSARFEEFHHAAGLRKNNPNFKAPEAAPASFGTEEDQEHSRRRRRG